MAMWFMLIWDSITMGRRWVHPSSSYTTLASQWVLLTFGLLFTFVIGGGGGVLIGTREQRTVWTALFCIGQTACPTELNPRIVGL